MKLYMAVGTCSLSPHIALREAGLPFEIERVDLRTKTTESGQDFRAINPKGVVPALRLDNGEVLTEGPAIIQYIADRHPAARLAPQADSFERYRLQEWLNYISSELHKSFAPIFNPNASAEARQTAIDALMIKLDFVSSKLEGKQYLMGDDFTVADGYLFTVLRWTQYAEIDLAKWQPINAYVQRVGARPNVVAALKAEGLA